MKTEAEIMVKNKQQQCACRGCTNEQSGEDLWLGATCDAADLGFCSCVNKCCMDDGCKFWTDRKRKFCVAIVMMHKRKLVHAICQHMSGRVR